MSKSCDGHVMVKHGKLRSSRKVRRKVQSKVLSFQLRYVGRVSTSDKKIFIFLFSRNYYSFYSRKYLSSLKPFNSRVSTIVLSTNKIGRQRVPTNQRPSSEHHYETPSKQNPMMFMIFDKIDKLSQKWSLWTFSGNQEILSWVVNCK